MTLHDIFFKDWAVETIKAPVTRKHYFDNEPWRTTLNYVPPSKRERRQAIVQGLLIDVLLKNPGATSESVSKITGRTVSNIVRNFQRMSRAGLIKHELAPQCKFGGRRKFMYFAITN